MIGEVRGEGFFVALELVKDRSTREPFTPAERAELISGQLLPAVRERGVHMKFDDRIELAALFAPPLVAGEPEFDLMVDALGTALDAAWKVAVERMGARG
jgi:adenosylmethionine-8-amino-7-oxononanoate aminotransferase